MSLLCAESWAVSGPIRNRSSGSCAASPKSDSGSSTRPCATTTRTGSSPTRPPGAPSRWRTHGSPRGRAFADSITAFCLLFYLVFLLLGGISSTGYALRYGQTNYSAWAPLMWPIKSIMTVGILLMLLQSIAIFFRDLARVLGRDIE